VPAPVDTATRDDGAVDGAVHSSLSQEHGVITNAKPVKEKSVMMTVEEVAERWGVNPRTIYGMIKKGRLKALNVGRLVRISRSHVEFLESGPGPRSPR
jgi:excisionase family DNA binding protein